MVPQARQVANPLQLPRRAHGPILALHTVEDVGLGLLPVAESGRSAARLGTADIEHADAVAVDARELRPAQLHHESLLHRLGLQHWVRELARRRQPPLRETLLNGLHLRERLDDELLGVWSRYEFLHAVLGRGG